MIPFLINYKTFQTSFYNADLFQQLTSHVLPWSATLETRTVMRVAMGYCSSRNSWWKSSSDDLIALRLLQDFCLYLANYPLSYPHELMLPPDEAALRSLVKAQKYNTVPKTSVAPIRARLIGPQHESVSRPSDILSCVYHCVRIETGRNRSKHIDVYIKTAHGMYRRRWR